MGSYTSNRLIREGLPVKWHIVKNNRFRVIDIDDFWKWAEKNKSILDFSRFEKYGLGAEPEWVDIKRKADFEKLQKHGEHNTAYWLEHIHKEPDGKVTSDLLPGMTWHPEAGVWVSFSEPSFTLMMPPTQAGIDAQHKEDTERFKKYLKEVRQE